MGQGLTQGKGRDGKAYPKGVGQGGLLALELVEEVIAVALRSITMT